MAHNLCNDKDMFYTGETPWHGLGTKLDAPATAKEAIEAANLDYTVELQPLFLQSGNKVTLKQAVVRTDNGVELGVVGHKYQPIQNAEAFNFFDVLVGEGQAIYHTAGALGRGERIWILAKLPHEIVVRKNDVVEEYMLLTNGHNGLYSTLLFPTPTRVVCQNTLNMALREMNGISIRHTGNIMSKLDKARDVLGITLNYYKQFEQIAKQMAEFKMTEELTNDYFDKMLSINDTKEVSTRTQNVKNELVQLFHNGKGNNGESLWDAYNSVTEMVDHSPLSKRQKEDPTSKLNSIWFGSGAQFKEEAWTNACELMKV